MRHRSFTERGLPCRDGPKLATFSCIPTGRYGGQIETATSSSSTVRLPASAFAKTAARVTGEKPAAFFVNAATGCGTVSTRPRAEQLSRRMKRVASRLSSRRTRRSGGQSWQECYERYRQHRTTRSRKKSLVNSISRIEIAERIFEKYREDRGLPEGLRVSECMTLDMMEYLQDQLLAGAESSYETRSPNTVNSTVGSIMAFVRFCKRHGWIDEVPPLEKLPVDDVMKGRPISGEELNGCWPSPRPSSDRTRLPPGSFLFDCSGKAAFGSAT